MGFITRLFAQRQSTADSAEQIVQRAVLLEAEGKEPNEQQLLELNGALQTLRLSLDDFRTMVNREVARQKQSAIVKEANTARAQLDSLTADFRRKQDAHLETQKRFDAECRSFTEQRQPLLAKIQAGETATRRLRELIEPEKLSVVADLNQQASEREDRLNFLYQRRISVQARLADAKKIDPGYSDLGRRQKQDAIDDAEQTLQSIEDEINAAQRKKESLRSEASRIDAAVMAEMSA